MLAVLSLGCHPPHGSPPDPTTTTESGSTAETGSTPTWTVGECSSPTTESGPVECRFVTDDWLVLCDLGGALGAEGTWSGQFTSFDRESAVHFEPDDGSDAPALLAFGSGGAWQRAPDLVGAGPVTLHTLGGCGEGFGGEWLTVVTRSTGETALVVGQTDQASLAGWSVALGDQAGSCPTYTVSNGCQACRANQPIHVTGPGFDATAWQSQGVPSGAMELFVGSAYQGVGLLCSDQSLDLYNWIVTPHGP